MLTELLDGFAAVGGLGHQRHVRLAVDDGGDSLAQQRMIINAQDADAGLITHFFPSFTGLGLFLLFAANNLAQHLGRRFDDLVWQSAWIGTDKSTLIPA